MAKKAKVSVKKVVAVPKHNVDVSQLSKQQLNQLVLDANVEIDKKKNEETKAALEKLKQSGKFQELKNQYEEFIQMAKEFQGKITTTINVPIDLFYTVEMTNPDEWDNCYYDDEMFEEELKGNLSKNNDLTKSQVKLLAPVVSDYIADACDIVYDLIPQAANLDKFCDSLFNFKNKINKLGLSLEDLK